MTNIKDSVFYILIYIYKIVFIYIILLLLLYIYYSFYLYISFYIYILLIIYILYSSVQNLMSRGVGYSEPILNPSKTNRNPPRINLNLFTLIHLSPSVLNRLSSYAANARSARASYPEPPFMWKFYKNIGRCVSLLSFP